MQPYVVTMCMYRTNFYIHLIPSSFFICQEHIMGFLFPRINGILHLKFPRKRKKT
jgi:hypothetical protein